MTKKKRYIVAVDQSTSATKVILFNQNAELLHRIHLPHQQFYPQSGFVEHDPLEIFNNTNEGIQSVISQSGTSIDEIAALAITNQRETVLIWDKNTGLPIANAAVWQCQRGVEYCNALREKGYNESIREKTGLLIDPYFSASKLWWLMNNTEGSKEMARNGQLLLGTIDTWLLWKLTDGKVHKTDYSNACRTLLFNIKNARWDEELIELFDLYPSMFPEVKFSDQIFGYTSPSVTHNPSLPIAGIMGDSHAALFGQGCFSPGMGKATYGTGSSIMLNIGEQPQDAPFQINSIFSQGPISICIKIPLPISVNFTIHINMISIDDGTGIIYVISTIAHKLWHLQGLNSIITVYYFIIQDFRIHYGARGVPGWSTC